MNVAAAAGLGVALGAVTGIPLGVVNVSVVEAATRVGARRAAAIGAGGALADATHAALAFVGVAPHVQGHRDLMRVLAGLSAAVVIGYAIVLLRGRAPRGDARAAGATAGVWRHVALGLGLTIFNPAPLAAWIAVAGALLPDAALGAGIAAAIGVGIGSAAWFALLARIAARGGTIAVVTRWMPRAVAVVLAAIAALAIVRAFR